jgi:hypothetical protein
VLAVSIMESFAIPAGERSPLIFLRKVTSQNMWSIIIMPYFFIFCG